MITTPLQKGMCQRLTRGRPLTPRGRIASKIFSGPHEYIPIDGVKMKAQQLCDLLNEKVAESLKN